MSTARTAGTPLADKLAARIRAAGPISVAEYMAACLGDPQHGYYMRRDPFGAAGDFITAPEVSQMFGELIGLWCVAVWERMGSPDRLVLAELGPGRGTLIADALRAARLRPAFAAAAELVLVETSPRMRAWQQATLQRIGVAPVWVPRAEDLPAGPLIVVANEFFDALPVRQYVRVAAGWAERMVGLGKDGGLVFGLRPLPGLPDGPSAPAAQPEGDGTADAGAPLGAVLEVRPAAEAVIAGLAARIARDGGAALVIDYGHAAPGFGDTLQAVRRHAYDGPLDAPGEADLTAHVDFSALARAARAAGADPSPVITQGAFLTALGLGERAAALARGKSADQSAAIVAAAERLTAPGAMGQLFKVLAITAPGLQPPGFGDG